MPSVLPLTREWIEMEEFAAVGGDIMVLPLTREWIEIMGTGTGTATGVGSPSYEGVA